MKAFQFAVVLSCLASAVAMAGGKPVVALYPPEVVSAEADELAQVRASMASELLRGGVELAPSEDVASWVEKHPSGGCLNLDDGPRVDCLAQLARKVGADKALLLVISPRARNELRISAQVVGKSGAELKNVSKAWPRPKGHAGPSVEAALREVLPDLELSTPETVITPLTNPDPEATNPVVEPVGPSPNPAVTTKDGTWKRTAGWVAVGAGAVLLGAGAYGLVDESAARRDLGSYYGGGRTHGVAEAPTLVALKDRIKRSHTLGVAGLGAGAVAAGLGAWFLLTAPPASPARAGDVSLLVGPGQVACTVVLP